MQLALSTLTVCVVVTLFSWATARFWAWFLKVDVLLFWLSAISRKLDKNKIERLEPTSQKSKLKEMYKQLLNDKRQN